MGFMKLKRCVAALEDQTQAVDINLVSDINSFGCSNDKLASWDVWKSHGVKLKL